MHLSLTVPEIIIAWMQPHRAIQEAHTILKQTKNKAELSRGSKKTTRRVEELRSLRRLSVLPPDTMK